MSAWWSFDVRGLKTSPSDHTKHLHFWMCRGLQLSYACAERQLPLFPITFPHAPHVLLTPQTTVLLYSLSHKYPEPLAFREVDLRLVLPSPPLATLWIKLLFAGNLSNAAFWLAVRQAKWTWFGNTISKDGLCRSILVPNFPLLHGHKTSLGEGIYGSFYFSGVSAFSQMREVPGRIFFCICWISDVFSSK